ncbi:cytochrome P450 family protein [Saccharothrix luteola]|uniref:cytochrome P450 family protein n=1 Tax=Saccharothrix luteola TaxID=2893018 RepID=UPI001E3263B7|nr:cytochrome P450 [Saccharothrix luteola]MCC8243557.1 cytochrome P450 [Saccharothrix luteola]
MRTSDLNIRRPELTVPEIDPANPEVLLDPFTAYGEARERCPVARMPLPGMGDMWILTRHEDAKAMLADPRFELSPNSFMGLPGIPEHCKPYLRTMSELNGPEHLRLRKLAAPAFTARRAEEFRPRVEAIVAALLDALPDGDTVDLMEHFARPLPMDVICELVGIPAGNRARWREYGAAVVSGYGPGFLAAIPGIVEGALEAVELRRTSPGDDLISQLLRVRDEHGDRFTDAELVTLVWQLVIAGQTPSNLIVNGLEALLAHPDQLAALRADPGLMPRAVEELTRWVGPQLLTVPRFTKEEVAFGDVVIDKGQPVMTAIVSANRDPRVYTAPDELDVTRVPPVGHLGYSHGAHFCLGAAFARVQTQVALSAVLRRFPDLALAETPQRTPDGGTWRLASLVVRKG